MACPWMSPLAMTTPTAGFDLAAHCREPWKVTAGSSQVGVHRCVSPRGVNLEEHEGELERAEGWMVIRVSEHEDMAIAAGRVSLVVHHRPGARQPPVRRGNQSARTAPAGPRSD